MTAVSDVEENAGSVVRIGVLGCGNVGAPLVELVATQRDAIAARTGLHLEVTRIAVRDLAKPRPAAIDPALLTTDAFENASGRRYLRARRPELYGRLVEPHPRGHRPEAKPGWRLEFDEDDR